MFKRAEYKIGKQKEKWVRKEILNYKQDMIM